MMEFMKNVYSSGSSDAILTVWPTNAIDRKGTFEICLNVSKGLELHPEDEITGTSGNNDQASVYTIEEIKERRPASVKGKEFIRANVTWRLRNLN